METKEKKRKKLNIPNSILFIGCNQQTRSDLKGRKLAVLYENISQTQ